MNTAEKLRFLADRAEDGKEFLIDEDYNKKYKFTTDNFLMVDTNFNPYWYACDLRIRFLSNYTFKLKPQWSFTEDEKVILRNLPEEYKWIARHKSGHITIHEYKPCKHNNGINWLDFKEYDSLSQFKHIFQSIQWSDEEPCEFRRYL